MSRLVAFLSNDPQRINYAFHPYRDLLVVKGKDNHDGWGLGYYQNGQVLLQKRPQGQHVNVAIADVVQSLRTDAFILHVREATVGSWKSENTHPFRFRRWLFAHRGTLSEAPSVRDGIAALIPEFLRRNIKGETDSEHAFHLFLARLHQQGRLSDDRIDVRHVAGTVSATLAQIDALAREAGDARESAVNLALMNGRVLVATRRGLPLHYRRVDGLPPEAMRDTVDLGPLSPAAAQLFRFVVVASDLENPQGWEEVPDSSVVTVDANLEVSVAPLEL